MNTKRTATMLLVAGAAALAGCQGMGGQFARKDLRIPKERSPEEYAAGQLSLGREALGLCEWGLAITSFRLVRHMPEHAAEASNGMAIAYANIGRPDLAERLFQQAAALAPGDRRFQANLTRFYETTPAFAVKTDRGAQLAAAPAAAAAPSVRTLAVGQNGATIRIALPAPRMVRVSGSEVRLGLPGGTPVGATPAGPGQRRAVQAAAVQVQASPAQVTAAQARRPALTVSNGRRLNPNFRRPATLTAPALAVTPVRGPVRAAAAYPVRITVGSR